jgi:hypothetical protein
LAFLVLPLFFIIIISSTSQHNRLKSARETVITIMIITLNHGLQVMLSSKKLVGKTICLMFNLKSILKHVCLQIQIIKILNNHIMCYKIQNRKCTCFAACHLPVSTYSKNSYASLCWLDKENYVVDTFV